MNEPNKTSSNLPAGIWVSCAPIVLLPFFRASSVYLSYFSGRFYGHFNLPLTRRSASAINGWTEYSIRTLNFDKRIYGASLTHPTTSYWPNEEIRYQPNRQHLTETVHSGVHGGQPDHQFASSSEHRHLTAHISSVSISTTPSLASLTHPLLNTLLKMKLKQNSPKMRLPIGVGQIGPHTKLSPKWDFSPGPSLAKWMFPR